MSKRDDGGAAFPQDTGHGTPCGGEGMTLRDYFAAKAMAALIDGYDYEAREKSITKADRTGFDDNPHASQLAEEAYIVADAMLKARNQ